MERDLNRLSRNEYDLVVVGGGIYGVCAAWDAAHRGLSVALVERGDFVSATSANSLKIVHGGFRYIQHADVRRIRDSSCERRVLMRIAPHLVHPLPFLVPTYGHGTQGKEMLTLALLLYDLIVFDRNRGVTDPGKRIPWGQVISKRECLHLFPGLPEKGLTGALIFYDAQMYSPPRLALSYLRSAVDAGADAANYLEVTGFMGDRSRVTGVIAQDLATGDRLEIRGKVILNASGPWVERLLGSLGLRLRIPFQVTKDLYLVVDRMLSKEYALAVPSQKEDPRAILSRGKRHFFVIPWRHRSLIGSSHVVYEGIPDEFEVTDTDIQDLLDEINEAYPNLALNRQDVSLWNSGLVPAGEHYGSRSHIIDHKVEDSLDGLVTIVGVRYTTSRGVAAQAVNLVSQKLGKEIPRSATAVTPIWGGRIACFDDFLGQMNRDHAPELSVEVTKALAHNYGSEYRRVLRYVEENPAWAETVDGSTVLQAEVIHAVREEMAPKLGDVVFRRTELGTAGHPGEPALRMCAELMAAELGWNAGRMEEELAEVRKVVP